MNIIFFFSSRRRHTISKRDWSSDVCSSDLHPYWFCYYVLYKVWHWAENMAAPLLMWQSMHLQTGEDFLPHGYRPPPPSRSEERRVGKECRYRETQGH